MTTDNTTPPAATEKPSTAVGATNLTNEQIRALSSERGADWNEAEEIAKTGGVRIGEKFHPRTNTGKGEEKAR